MANRLNKAVFAATALALTTGMLCQTAAADGNRMYEVTVTNLTNNVTFTPILGVTHTKSVSLFEEGHPASDGLEMLAEGGSPAGIINAISSVDHVNTAVATAAGTPADGPFTAAGESATFLIEASKRARLFSMSAMLLPTNDSFAAVSGVRLPWRGSVTYYAKGYDAGTELNDQLCVNIPGPQCDGNPDGEGFNASRNDRGDFVHISSGVHDAGDLLSVDYDWRNPVAAITITRVRH